MGNLLYYLAILLLLAWALAFFAGGLGTIAHMFLLLAVFSFLIRWLGGKTV